MEYRGFKYTVNHAAHDDHWIWEVRFSDNIAKSGTAATRSAAESHIVRVINRAIAIRSALRRMESKLLDQQ